MLFLSVIWTEITPRNGEIDQTYSRDGAIHIASSNIRDGKVIKILNMSMLLDIFPDFDFGPNDR